MKKILVFLLPLLFFACQDDKVIVLSKEEYDKLKGQEVIYSRPFKFKHSKVPEYTNWFISEGEDGHEYLHNEGHNSFILFHYPECKKCTK